MVYYSFFRVCFLQQYIRGNLYVRIIFSVRQNLKGSSGNELKNAFNQLTSEVSSKFALSIPPAAITLAIIIIITWLFFFYFKYP